MTRTEECMQSLVGALKVGACDLILLAALQMDGFSLARSKTMLAWAKRCLITTS